MNGRGVLQYNTHISFDDINLYFAANQVMPSADISLSISSGDMNSYPFDSYNSDTFAISGVYTDLNGNLHPANLLISLVGSIHAWNVEVPYLLDTSANHDGTTLVAEIDIYRSVTTKVSHLQLTCMTLFRLLTLTQFHCALKTVLFHVHHL